MLEFIAWVGVLGLGVLIGLGIGADEARAKRIELMNRAVANGCAIRVLDSASGEVKTVWKDGKP